MINIKINNNKKILKINDNEIDFTYNPIKIKNNGIIIDKNNDKEYNIYKLELNEDNKIQLIYKSLDEYKLIDVYASEIEYEIEKTKVYVVISLKSNLSIDTIIKNVLRQDYPNKYIILILNNYKIDEKELEYINKISSIKIIENKEKLKVKINKKGKTIIYFEENIEYDYDYISNLVNIKNSKEINLIYKDYEICQYNTKKYIIKVKDKLLLESDTNDTNDTKKYYNNGCIKIVKNKIIKNKNIVFYENSDINLIDEYYKYSEINYIFDKIYILNLERRNIKRERMIKIMKKYNIKYEIVYGEDNKDFINQNEYKTDVFNNNINIGEYCCSKSMIKILNDAKKNKFKKILIFEDDILLSKDFEKNIIEILQNKDIKKNRWKLLFLGSSDKIENIDKKVNKNNTNCQIYKVNNKISGAFAIGISMDIADQIIIEAKKYISPFDLNPLRKIITNYDCYCIYPNLVIADVTESDIRDNNKNSNWEKRCNWDYSNYN